MRYTAAACRPAILLSRGEKGTKTTYSVPHDKTVLKAYTRETTAESAAEELTELAYNCCLLDWMGVHLTGSLAKPKGKIYHLGISVILQ